MLALLIVAAAGSLAPILPQPTPQAPAQPAAQPTAQPTAQPQPETTPEPQQPSVIDKLQAEAAKLAPLVKSELAKDFLAQVPRLPDPGIRKIYRSRETSEVLNAADWAKLPTERQTSYKSRACSPEFYYYTGYGSPLVYVRIVDLMAQHGITTLDRKKVLDFGYGTIGQLRLMAELGAEAHGVDVEPTFPALYSQPTDTGTLTKGGVKVATHGPGAIAIHNGRWPADKPIADAIAGGYDAITSKNTLKAGYIHPAPPAGKTVNEAMLVKLGVDDAAYLHAVHDALKPGGLFIIYNICPAQTPADDLTKPYIPYADGKCPFTKDQLAAAHLEVLAFDITDNDWVLDCWAALGYDDGKPRAEAAKDVFSWYTIAKRKD